MNFYLLIPFFIIVLFMAPFLIEVRGAYNLFDNKGSAGIFLFGVKIKSLIFYLEKMEVKVKDDDDRRARKFDLDSNEAFFYQTLIKQIGNKTKVKLISVLYNIGIGDSAETALVCGVLNTLLVIIMARVKSLKPTASMLICDNPSFNDKVFQVVARTKFSISIFDIVYSLIVSVILTNREKINI